jgi:hypothetical protein
MFGALPKPRPRGAIADGLAHSTEAGAAYSFKHRCGVALLDGYKVIFDVNCRAT